MLLRGILNALRAAKVEISCNDIKDCAILTPQAWADANGYPRHRTSIETARAFPTYAVPLVTPTWRGCLDGYAATLGAPVEVAYGKDVIVSSYAWPHPSAGFNEQFDYFSQNYDMWNQDPFWLQFLAGKGMFCALDSVRARVLIDFGGAAIKRIATKSVFIGSTRNWGHWLLDFLARTMILPELPDPEARTVVCGPLSEKQKICLEIFGVPRDRIIELNAKALTAYRYQFDDLVCTPAIPHPTGFAYLRKGFTAAADLRITAHERVFISRRKFAPRHRVVNLDEVEAFFRGQGFFITDDLPSLSIREQAGLFRNTRIVAMPFGADLGTLAMCPATAAAIVLVSDEYARNQDPEIARREAVTGFFQDIPLVPVYGPAENPADSTVEANARFDLDALDEAIQRGVALSSR